MADMAGVWIVLRWLRLSCLLLVASDREEELVWTFQTEPIRSSHLVTSPFDLMLDQQQQTHSSLYQHLCNAHHLRQWYRSYLRSLMPTTAELHHILELHAHQ